MVWIQNFIKTVFARKFTSIKIYKIRYIILCIMYFFFLLQRIIQVVIPLLCITLFVVTTKFILLLLFFYKSKMHLSQIDYIYITYNSRWICSDVKMVHKLNPFFQFYINTFSEYKWLPSPFSLFHSLRCYMHLMSFVSSLSCKYFV